MQSLTEHSRTLLRGKVVLVVGASRGIGAAIARAFADAGASVALAARDSAALEQLRDELIAAGGQALAVPTDVTDADSVARLIDLTMKTFGRIDIACNNAGGSGHPPTPLAEVSLDDFDATFAINLRGVFVAMKCEIPAMLKNGGGAIVNMASTTGLQGVAGLAAYVSTKHGVVGLTKVAALDYAAHGIRVNAIAPGPILTDQLRNAGEQAQKGAAAAMPMQRIGQPHEVAAAAVWLCSDASAFVTGTTFVIDGGKLAGSPAFATQRERSS